MALTPNPSDSVKSIHSEYDADFSEGPPAIVIVTLWKQQVVVSSARNAREAFKSVGHVPMCLLFRQ